MTDISIFITDLGGGGAEKVIVNLANGFAHQGQSVDLVLARREGQYVSEVDPKVRIVDLGGVKLFRCLPRLTSYIKREKPKILLSALEDTNIVAICASKLALRSTKVIVTVHNHLTSEATYEKNWKRKIVPYFLRLFYPFASTVVAVSRGVAIDLSRWTKIPIDQIKVIHNPIVTPDLKVKQQEIPNHPWLVNNTVPIILGVGRLHPQKDFSTLLHAFSEVLQQRSARLLILGEGQQRKYLEALSKELGIQDSVQFPGFVQNPYSYMADASICVLSSAWEGFGNVLVEAMSAGTPVVSTDCQSGPAEILADGEYGKLVPVGDVGKLAEAILQTLEHPINSQKLKQRAEDFSLEAAIIQYGEIFALNE